MASEGGWSFDQTQKVSAMEERMGASDYITAETSPRQRVL